MELVSHISKIIEEKKSLQDKGYILPYHWFTDEATKGGRLYHGYLKLCLEMLDSDISKNAPALLDAGCGDGRFLKTLQDAGFTNIFGVDYSADAIAFAKLVVPMANTISTDLKTTPFADNFFDAIFLIETLEHFPPSEINATLKELARILKPCGQLIVSVPSDKRPAGGKHWQHFSVDHLKETLDNYFSCEHITGQDKVNFHALKLVSWLIDNKYWQITPLARYYNLNVWPRFFNTCSPNDGRRLIGSFRKK